MSRRSGAALALAGLAAQAVMVWGPPDLLPEGARVVLAFAVLVLLPGAAFVALGAVPPGGAWLGAGWALGFGVAWLGGLVLVAHFAGQPFTVLAAGSMLTTALLWGAVLWLLGRGTAVPGHARPGILPGLARVRRARHPWLNRARLRWSRDSLAAPPSAGARAAGARWGRLSLVALLLAVGVGALHAGRLGTPLGLETDSPDHIGTVRRMMDKGDPFPRDAFFRDAGEAGVDPRKGLWHAGVALIARLAVVDPIVAWRWLPVALVPLFALNAAVFGYLLRGPPGAAVAAWALVLTYGGSLAAQYLREAVFATKLGDQLALATAAAVLADLRAPARRLRYAAVGLGLGALVAHVYYAIQFAMVFAALGAGLLVADRGWSGRIARLTGTALAIGAAGLPWLLWRASQSYAPSNVIHTVPQGLMALAGEAWIVSPGVLWDWLGNWWVLFPLAAIWLWREGRRDPAVLYLVTTPAIVALVIFNPLAVALLQPRLGYLLMRMVWMVPLAALLAWMLPSLVAALRHGAGARPRLAAAAALLGITAISWEALEDARWVLAHPREAAALGARTGAGSWRDDLDWMKAHLPGNTVVLSDPATSYSIPMFTGLYVATLVDQHSSPNDSLALTRILDARDALDPWGTWARLREVVGRHAVDVIALNDRFAVPPVLDYWSPNPAWFRAARARFDAVPAAFERLHDRGDFVVYRVRRAVLDTLAIPAVPRPWLGPPLAPTIETAPDRQGLPVPATFALSAVEAAPGDTVSGVIGWRGGRTAASPAAAYRVAVRFDRPPPGPAPPRWLAKPARKIAERIRGERYRFRSDHLPVRGAYGVDLWPADRLVRDSFAVLVPADVATGEYAVRVRMLAQPHYPNYRVSDYFFEDDYYAGTRVGTLRVTRARSAAGGG